MSITSSVGLVGLSRKNSFVFGLTAFSHSSGLVPSTRVVSIPYFGSKVSITQRHEPNSARADTTWSPARAVHSIAAETAAMPDAVARASSAPSSAHMRFSNMSTVGLA